MTTIHFHYTDSYNNPSRGSLAFMPHRRHAANETEVLPKPFTVPLLNGEVTVNLQPNSSSWVWIVTEYFENISKSFFTTIPDRDGVLEHTELVHISPSSIPAAYDAVEPVWWAEMRQYKTTVSDTLLQSSEALTEARAAIETGRESVERTQHNASVAGAYADESRQSSYDARDYRDEAEQWRNEAQEQADRAASGPESAAARALVSEQNAKISEDAARGHENSSRISAAEARADATTANTSASQAVTARTESTSQADRAQTEANRAQGYADDLLSGPQTYVTESQAARDDAREYRDEAQGLATTAQQYSHDSSRFAVDSENHANDAADSAQSAQNALDSLDTPWIQLEPNEPWTSTVHVGGSVQYKRTPFGVVLTGGLMPNGATEDDPLIQLPFTVHRPTRHTVAINNEDIRVIGVSTDGQMTVYPGEGNITRVALTGVVIPLAEFSD